MTKKTITVVSLGICGTERLTAETLDALKSSDRVILRTGLLPCAEQLKEQGVCWTSLDSLYDRYEDFDTMHDAMADLLWKEAGEAKALVYGVIDARGDGSVRSLARKAGKGDCLNILPGLSLFDLYCAVCPALRDAVSVTVLPAAEACETVFDPDQAYLITEADSGIRAGEIKLWMESAYDDEAAIWFMSAPDGKLSCKRIDALEADRQKDYDHTSAFFIPVIPFEKRAHFTFTGLNRLMDRLRGFDGCPWDREQTHESLKTYLLEETWEVEAAIDGDDPDHLADELGDLLLQIAFHASIGKDFDEFTAQDVVDHICRKMIRRHSHIFGSDSCETPEQVSEVWEKRKRDENGEKTLTDTLVHVPDAMPSLMYASKVLKKASRYPWWNERFPALLEELRQSADPDACSLLQTVAETREKSHDPEILLHDAVKMLINRLEEAENRAKKAGNSLERLTNNELDVYL